MAKKSKLPPTAEKRLRPYIERGITSGVFADETPVVELWKRKTTDDRLKETIEQLGGMGSEVAHQFLTDVVLTDLTAILRQKRYTAHVEVWEVNHRTIGQSGTNPRQVCFLFGQAVVDDDGSEMEPALFRMGLWDDDASIADDIERDGVYEVSVSCKVLNSDVLELRPIGALTHFKTEEFDHSERSELVCDTFDVVPIAELEDCVSRGFNDYRLVKGTISFSGVQNSRSGNQFGKMLLKDDSTMTMEAIESGENLLLNCMTSVDIAQRFGKYSQVLALVTTKINGEYGLSANMETCVGTVVVTPPEPESQASGDDSDDDAADYFSDDSTPLISDDDDEDEDDDDDETIEEVVTESEEPEPEEADDDEAVDYAALPVVALKAMAKAEGISGFSTLKKAELVAALSGESDSDDADDTEEASEPTGDDADDDDWDDWD